RLELGFEDAGDRHRIAVGFKPGQPKRLQVDGADVERLTDSPARPLASVFLPDRLELVVGAPALRRAHLDQLIAALWPARARPRWPPSSRSASTPTSSAGSPATAPTATSWRSCAMAASCAPTGRAASSASPCSRCCSPSGRSSRRSAALLRCCCSTT